MIELRAIGRVESSLNALQRREGAPEAVLLFEPEVGACSTRARRTGRTRSGCTRVEVLAVDGGVMTVRPLEAVHGTPIVDVKPVL